jgi:hypothetical protein
LGKNSTALAMTAAVFNTMHFDRQPSCNGVAASPE